MSRYTFYMRSGSSRNSELELIYNDLLTNMGSAYSDNTLTQTFVQTEIFAYAKAIYFLHQQVKEVKNNNLYGGKLTYNLAQAVKDYNIEFLRSDCEKLLFISLIQATQSTAINEKSLTTILKALAPISFISLYVNDTSDEIMEPNYIQTTEKGLIQPYDTYYYTNGFSIPGGIDWTQYPMLGYTSGSMFSSSMNVYRIIVKKTEQFNYEIQKITAFLNVILPSYIGFTFQTTFQTHLENDYVINLLDGDSITITGTATYNKSYILTLTFVGNQSSIFTITIIVGILAGDSANTVTSKFFSTLSTAGISCSKIANTININDYRILTTTLTKAPATPVETNLLVNILNTNYNTNNIILDGYHSLL